MRSYATFDQVWSRIWLLNEDIAFGKKKLNSNNYDVEDKSLIEQDLKENEEERDTLLIKLDTMEVIESYDNLRDQLWELDNDIERKEENMYRGMDNCDYEWVEKDRHYLKQLTKQRSLIVSKMDTLEKQKAKKYDVYLLLQGTNVPIVDI